MTYEEGVHTIPGDVRAWGDRSRTHKMGWLRTGDVILVANAYKNWRRFEPAFFCEELLPLTEKYTDYFVNVLDIPADPTPEPEPEPEVPTEVVDALVVLLTWLKS